MNSNNQVEDVIIIMNIIGTNIIIGVMNNSNNQMGDFISKRFTTIIKKSSKTSKKSNQGFLGFVHHRVPRSAMLARNSKVSLVFP